MMIAEKKYSFQEPTSNNLMPCFECGVKTGTLPQIESSTMCSSAPISAKMITSMNGVVVTKFKPID